MSGPRVEVDTGAASATRRSLPLAILLGPFGLATWTGCVAALLTLGVLTLLTEVGGLSLWPWIGPIERVARARRTVAGRGAVRTVGYALAWALGTFVVLPPLAALGGRVPLPSGGGPLGPAHPGYVLLQRRYVRPALRDALVQAADEVAERHPGTVVRYLDAGFPFAGLPLLPHLSHGDGRRVDLAFFYTRDGEPVDGGPSPIGYGVYVPPRTPAQHEAQARRDRACEGAGTVLPWVGRVPLRWDLPFLQGWAEGWALDEDRTRDLLLALAEIPEVDHLLLEPTLHGRLEAGKLLANGCGVARHDDHVHVAVGTR